MYNYVMLKDAATYFEAQQQFLKQVYPLILKCMWVYIALTLSATNVTVMGSIIYQGLPWFTPFVYNQKVMYALFIGENIQKRSRNNKSA